MSATLRLAERLIALPSVTPEDGGCTELINSQLATLGFNCEVIDLGPDHFRVRNLWAKRAGTSGQTLAFAGHTDVVPTGPLAQWSSDP
ncbi:MAG: Succinyl-diaminopimelate desuccinylase, partial [Pseudomonadota bacterium]